MRSLIAVAVVATLCSCSGGGPIGSRYIKTVEAVARAETTLAVTAQDDATAARASLFVPEGALAQNATLTVEISDTAVAANPDLQSSPAVAWGPSDLVFEKDVTITLPYSLAEGISDQNLFVEFVAPDGTHRTIARDALVVDTAAGTVAFTSNHLGSVQVAVHGCNANHPCNVGETCSSAGHCEATTTCSTGTACPTGSACDHTGHCIATAPQCSANHACPSGYSCTAAGTCEPSHSGCTDNSSCPSGTECTAGGTCEPSPAQCNASHPCSSGQHCVNGICEAACSHSVPCPSGQQCTSAGVCH